MSDNTEYDDLPTGPFGRPGSASNPPRPSTDATPAGSSLPPAQYGQPTPSSPQPYPGQPVGYQPTPGAYGAPGYPAPDYPGYAPAGFYSAPLRRPGSVTAAAILTWIGTGFGLIFGLILTVASASIAEEIVKDDVSISLSEAKGMMLAVGIFLLIMSAAALALSIMAFKGNRWGAYLILIPGAVMVILWVWSMAVSKEFAPMLSVAWVVASCVLFLLPASRNWYDAKGLERSGARL